MVRSKGAKRKALAAAGGENDAAAPASKHVKRGDAGASPAAEKEDDGNDPRRVYASRLPTTWTDESLRGALEVFGAVGKANVVLDHDDKSRLFGFVVFEDEAGKAAALAAGFVRGKEVDPSDAKKKVKYAVKISDVNRAVADDTVCHLWLRSICPHGDKCKFDHPAGLGACLEKSTKVKKCLEFRKKGRCSRGDSCPFKHVAGAKKPTPAADAPRPTMPTTKKPCFNWVRKGKCRKGDRCAYAHETSLDEC